MRSVAEEAGRAHLLRWRILKYSQYSGDPPPRIWTRRAHFGSVGINQRAASLTIGGSISAIPNDPPRFYAENAYSWGLFAAIKTLPINGKMPMPFLVVSYYLE